MPAAPRRRLPGTLAKNNVVNEIIDYLAGNSSPENSLGQSLDVSTFISRPLIAQVQSRDGTGKSTYTCKILYVRPSDAYGDELIFGIDAANFPDEITVHYLPGAFQTGDEVDLTRDDTKKRQSGLQGGTLLEVRPIVRPSSDNDSTIIWVSFSAIQPSGVFPVALEKTSGTDGTQTTAATWAYKATGLASSVVLGEGLTPLYGRPKGSVSIATRGLGSYDQSGGFSLEIAYEIPATEACPTS